MALSRDPYTGTTALSANWTVIGGAASCVAGVLTGSVWPFYATWNATTFGTRQSITLTLTGVPASSVGGFVRLTAGLNGYSIGITSAGSIIVQRLDAGIGTTLQTLTGYTFVAGDLDRLDIVGSSLRVFYNGVPQGSASTDATYSAAASMGVFLSASGDTIDEWLGNDVCLIDDDGWLGVQSADDPLVCVWQ